MSSSSRPARRFPEQRSSSPAPSRSTRSTRRPRTPDDSSPGWGSPSASTETTELAKAIGKNTLSGDLDAYLLQHQEQDRRQDVIHPSELVKPDWCPRAEWLKIRRARAGLSLPSTTTRLFLQNIFDEGHTIHDKWQTRLWDIGYLEGVFECLRCRFAPSSPSSTSPTPSARTTSSSSPTAPGPGTRGRWYAISPSSCPTCGAPRELLRYREVPVSSPEHLIEGHADGKTLRPGEPPRILEVKSIGTGTVRIEQPALLAEFTLQAVDEWDRHLHKVVDVERLFKSIARPFVPHLKQAGTYARILGISDLLFLYESKMTQQHKFFSVPVSSDYVDPLLDMAADVKDALDRDRPPACIHGAKCAKCKALDEIQDRIHADQQRTPARVGPPAQRGGGRLRLRSGGGARLSAA